jgi:sorting nexin-8
MNSSFARSRQSLFDEESNNPSNSNSIFQDDDVAGSRTASPWDMPTPRKQHSRADILRNLLPASDAPDGYIETFDSVVRDDGSGGKVTSGGVMRVLAAAKIGADDQARIMGIIAPGGGEVALGRNEFNVFLGLVGLAQERETISLDSIDERRRSECPPAALSALSANPSQSTHNAHLVPHKRLYRGPQHPSTRPLSLICDRHWHHVLQVDALFAWAVLSIGPPAPNTQYPSRKSQSSCGAAPRPPAVPCSTLPDDTHLVCLSVYSLFRVFHRHSC